MDASGLKFLRRERDISACEKAFLCDIFGCKKKGSWQYAAAVWRYPASRARRTASLTPACPSPFRILCVALAYRSSASPPALPWPCVPVHQRPLSLVVLMEGTIAYSLSSVGVDIALEHRMLLCCFLDHKLYMPRPT
jgi:hypothetical protein